MDLSALNSTLPQGLAEAERDMGEKFRGESVPCLLFCQLLNAASRCTEHHYAVQELVRV